MIAVNVRDTLDVELQVVIMPCKGLRSKTRVEQDFYLQWSDRPTSEEERLDFLRYDSHGGLPPRNNPVLAGKVNYHFNATEWLNAYFVVPGYEGMWPGGMHLVIEERNNHRFLEMLRREFGEKALQRWFRAAWERLFSWVLGKGKLS